MKKCLRFTLIGAACLAVLAALTVFITNLVVLLGTKDRIVPADAVPEFDADCILVLGCGVRDDGTPSHMLEDRLLYGIDLYKKGVANKLLMSGDHGRADYDEVNAMKDYAMAQGIPSEDIFMDHAGFSTYESMCRAKEVFGVKKMIIATQGYHLSRAVYIARMLGIEAYGVASDYRTFGGQFYRDCREVLARVKDLFVGIVQPAPTYLGEMIPISGDGTLTSG